MAKCSADSSFETRKPGFQSRWFLLTFHCHDSGSIGAKNIVLQILQIYSELTSSLLSLSSFLLDQSWVFLVVFLCFGFSFGWYTQQCSGLFDLVTRVFFLNYSYGTICDIRNQIYVGRMHINFINYCTFCIQVQKLVRSQMPVKNLNHPPFMQLCFYSQTWQAKE